MNNHRINDNPMRRRILVYSPYGGAVCHNAYEATISAGLRLRGAEIRIIGCDSLLPECDAHWESTHPRDPQSCERCMTMQKELMERFDFPFEWMGRYLDDETVEAAARWVRGLETGELLSAVYRDYPLGVYTKSSVHSHFRMSELDLGDARTNEVFRRYLYGAVLTLEAVSRAISAFRPEVLIMFNGRFFTHRTVLELARKHSIPVYVHERGRMDNSLTIWENESCHGFSTVLENWEHWKDMPLTRGQLEEIDNLFRQRREGVNTGWFSFVSNRAGEEELLEQLRIPAGQTVVSLFTSSEDEFAAFETRNSILDQYDWIERTIRFFRGKDDFILVIRVHPNTFPADQFLVKLRLLGMALPRNVRIVMPKERINSYQLADISQSCLFFLSRMVAEIAVTGKPVLICGNGLWYGHGFALNPPNADTYEEHLDKLTTEDFSRERMRWAYRFAYHYYHRTNIPFPLVSIQEVFKVSLAYSGYDDLLPGRDAALDRICAAILHGGPLYPHPPGVPLSPLAEESFLLEKEKLLNPGDKGSAAARALQPARTPQRILMVCHSIPPHEFSGTPLITLEQAIEFRDRGLQVAIMIADDSREGSFSEEELSGMRLFRVPAVDRNRVFFEESYSSLTGSADYLNIIAGIWDRFSPDVVHINDAVDMPPVILQFFAGRNAVVVRQVWNDEEICFRISPVIAETRELCSGPETIEKCEACYYKTRRDPHHPPYHSLDPNLKTGLLRHANYLRYLYTRKTDGIVFSSPSFKEHFTAFLPVEERKVRIIPHGTGFQGEERATRGKREEGSCITFTFMGNLHDYRKGMETLLEAFDTISAPDGFRLEIHGDASDSPCLALIDKLAAKYPGRIHCHGPYRPDQIPGIMATTDVGIIPSYFETYSRVLREFLVHGIPVITSKFFGSEIIADGYNGFVVGIGDGTALREKIDALIKSPALLNKLTLGAAATPVATVSDEIDMLLELYGDLLTSDSNRNNARLLHANGLK